jgi:hypothetical protein
MRHFLLMSTSGCHLCDKAADIIVRTLDPELHSVDEVDIALDDDAVARYGVRIPVLVDEASAAELGWPFDEAGLLAFIAALPCKG